MMGRTVNLQPNRQSDKRCDRGRHAVTASFLTPNLKVSVEYHEEKPLGVELPKTVDLKVTEVVPGMKTATATSAKKTIVT